MAHRHVLKPAPKDTKRDVNGMWQHDLFDLMEQRIQEKSPVRENVRPAGLYISNLNFNVSEQDLMDLFSSIGRLQNVCLHYDKSGRSLGTAKIYFERKVDELEAVDQYDGRLLDKKKIKIEFLLSSIKTIPIRHRREIERHNHRVDNLTGRSNTMNLK